MSLSDKRQIRGLADALANPPQIKSNWPELTGIPMGRLTTHVLDTALGKPAAGLRIELFRLNPNPTKITEANTNADGRCNAPLLDADAFQHGTYELHFHAGSYLKTSPFLTLIPIRFTISEDRHYHVPLLLSPFGYTTYRGS